MRNDLVHFVRVARTQVARGPKDLRIVHHTEIADTAGGKPLSRYVADRVPLFYRALSSVTEDLEYSGCFMTAVRTTLGRLPTSESFIESHFAEIAAALFSEQILGYRRLYSKLTMLTSENQNAHKMDLLMYDPSERPFPIIAGEVKSSMKAVAPAAHDKSCYADVFNSLRNYDATDFEYDLSAANDRLHDLPPEDTAPVRDSLSPYSASPRRYIGFIVIDAATFDTDECRVLATRKSDVQFSVDLIAVERVADVAGASYERLQRVLEVLRE